MFTVPPFDPIHWRFFGCFVCFVCFFFLLFRYMSISIRMPNRTVELCRRSAEYESALWPCPWRWCEISVNVTFCVTQAHIGTPQSTLVRSKCRPISIARHLNEHHLKYSKHFRRTSIPINRVRGSRRKLCVRTIMWVHIDDPPNICRETTQPVRMGERRVRSHMPVAFRLGRAACLCIQRPRVARRRLWHYFVVFGSVSLSTFPQHWQPGIFGWSKSPIKFVAARSMTRHLRRAADQRIHAFKTKLTN